MARKPATDSRSTVVTPRARVLDDHGNKQVVIDALKQGMSLSSAASLVGLSRKGLHEYRRDYPEFHDACIKAVAGYELEKLELVNKGCEDDAKLALEVLARRFPGKWSTRSEVRTFGDDSEDERDEDELSDEELEKAARSRGRPGH